MTAPFERSVVLAFDDWKETRQTAALLAGGVGALVAGVLVLAWIGETFRVDAVRWLMVAWAVAAIPLLRLAFNAKRFRRRVAYRLVLGPSDLEIDRAPDDGPATQTRLPRGFPGLRLTTRQLDEAGTVQHYPTIALPDGRLAFQALDRPVTDQVSGATEPLSAWLARWWAPPD